MKITERTIRENLIVSLMAEFQKQLPPYIIVSRHFMERVVDRNLDLKKVIRILIKEICPNVCVLIFQQFLEDRESEGTCISFDGYIFAYKFVRETNRLWLKSIYLERV